jgi:hypothetical protein
LVVTSEKSLQQYAMKLAYSHGIYCRKVQAIGHTGFPDVFMARAGRIILIELKSPKGTGRLSAKQKLEIKKLKEEGVNVYVCETRECVDHAIRQLADA